jgi:acetyltransferase-like isoleucine patch superfamily enzyme
MRARNKLITKIIGQIGKSFLIEQPFMCDYGYNIEIGENFCSNHNLLILDSAKVTIGDNVLIGPNCSFYTSTHPINYKERKLGTELAKPIKIGNNVWLGGNVVVLAGVSIGDNSVIGAGSVVSRDIPPNTVAVGNPCRVIKNIND